YSTSFTTGGELRPDYFNRQLTWAMIGLAGFIVASILPTRFIQALAYVFYGFGLFLLLAVLAVGASEHGSTRWLVAGSLRVQPSEIMKASLVVGLARFLSDHPKDLASPRIIAVALLMALIPMGLVVAEPDLGTSLVFPAVVFCFLAWAGVPASHLLLLVMPLLAVITSWHLKLHLGVLVVLLVLLWRLRLRLLPMIAGTGVYLIAGGITPRLWMNLHDYQRQRILTFLNPEADPLGSAYQIIQSKIAIGSGGVMGKGFLKGTQTQLKFLPEQHTDFIFSAWGEEFGFMGALLVVLLFGLIIFRGFQFASRAHNPFNSLLAAGVCSTLAFQVLLNLFVAIGWLPVTGLPLPFISYGGSSLVIYMTMMGLLLGVTMRWRQH
ncbi:MAG: rod shape-determining protein RodA, partial [Calditrichaeota bacterium]|nr:rod shape-determining protein RodA [Calditrichota bacterium]